MKKENLKNTELTHILSWVTTILDFFIAKSNNPKEFDVFDTPKKIALQVFNEGNLRGMRMLLKDTNEWSKALSLKDYGELNILLSSKFGFNLSLYDRKNKKEVNRIVKQGEIKSDEEYELLEMRVSELSTNAKLSTSQIDEINIINRLLGAFYKSQNS